MYGMVNRFLVVIIKENQGMAIWEQVEKAVSHDTSYFVGMEQYPDEIAYDIVTAASQASGLSADEILNAAGKGWVNYTSQTGYGGYYSMANDVFSMLRNMNSVHTSIGASVEKLNTPKLDCVEIDEKTMELRYASDRPGLTFFVKGVIEGAAAHYNQDISIELIERRDDGAAHDKFIISVN